MTRECRSNMSPHLAFSANAVSSLILNKLLCPPYIQRGGNKGAFATREPEQMDGQKPRARSSRRPPAAAAARSRDAAHKIVIFFAIQIDCLGRRDRPARHPARGPLTAIVTLMVLDVETVHHGAQRGGR
ncbi:hypothetical protein EVAR_16111_1 [Eumeta japonica]|uniref:Uncharacterized protein n=1 Tax=Eumeta variegata TaxID=151549 RepID=A0A4C1UIL0_EUMVA|nr:hypothetical protein EVAR_16111_1 [Eumeta japonica]